MKLSLKLFLFVVFLIFILSKKKSFETFVNPILQMFVVWEPNNTCYITDAFSWNDPTKQPQISNATPYEIGEKGQGAYAKLSDDCTLTLNYVSSGLNNETVMKPEKSEEYGVWRISYGYNISDPVTVMRDMEIVRPYSPDLSKTYTGFAGITPRTDQGDEDQHDEDQRDRDEDKDEDEDEGLSQTTILGIVIGGVICFICIPTIIIILLFTLKQ